MDRQSFLQFLRASGLTKGACSSRATLASRVERDFNVNLDTVVQNDNATLDLITRIYASAGLTKPQRYNLPNAVRKYYLLRIGRPFGRLCEYAHL